MSAPILPMLSRRQKLVICLFCLGDEDHEIADRLFIAKGTVRNHLKVVRETLGGMSSRRICLELGRELERREGKG